MGLWETTVEGLRWLRAAFERVAPGLAKTCPWIGCFLLVIAGACAATSWRFAHGRVRAMATVTENVPSFAKEGGILYYPRLRFRAADGEIVQVVAGPGTEDIDFAAGEVVPVLYVAGDPRSAIIATMWRAYHAAIIFGLWGTALFDLGWAIRVMMQARSMRSGIR